MNSSGILQPLRLTVTEIRPYVRPPWSRVAIEDELLVAFEARTHLTGSTTATFRQLEVCLGGLFAGLSPTDARELHRRFSNPAPDDDLAKRFGQMIVERRQRLIAFLADAPRRAAISSHGVGR